MRFCSLLHGFLFKSHDLRCYVKPRRYSLFYISIKIKDYVISPYQVRLSKTTKHWDGFVSHCNSAPTRAHLICAKGVLRYLAGTVSLSLQFPSPSSVCLPDLSSPSPAYGLSDANWASDEKDCKSISGYSFFFFNSLVSWSSRKQRIVSTSSTESEYYALTNAFKEAIWLQLFLTLTKLPTPRPFTIFCNNQSTCIIAKSDTVSSRTKHIDVRHHFIRQHISNSTFSTIWIPTTDMTADIFTKPLSLVLFLHHHDSLGLILP